MRLPQWLDPPVTPEERRPAEPPKAPAPKEGPPKEGAKSTSRQEEPTGAGLNVGPAVGTFAVVAALALFPIAALLLCIGILALVHAIF